MNEQEVRALVREAVERYLGRPDGNLRGTARRNPAARWSHSDHTSHVVLNVLSGSEVDDGMCMIEPAARCSHCKFCRSYGH